MRIYKYPLEIRPGKQIIQAPKHNFEVLDIGIQRDKFVIWAAVNDAPPHNFDFHIFWTGDEVPDNKDGPFYIYLKTLTYNDLVYHIFYTC